MKTWSLQHSQVIKKIVISCSTFVSGCFRNCTVTHLLETLHKLAGVLREETKQLKKTVLFRNTLPQHYAGPEIPSQNYEDSPEYLNSSLRKDNRYLNQTFDQMHWTSFYLEKVSRLYGFGFLDSDPLYTDRWDLHFQLPGASKVDCSHYCYTPELFVPEVALLTELLPWCDWMDPAMLVLCEQIYRSEESFISMW